LVTFASQTMCDYHFYLGANGARADTMKWNKDGNCLVCNVIDCNVDVTGSTTIREIRAEVAKKLDVVEQSVMMNPDQDELAEGVAAMLLFAGEGPLAEQTKGNLDLTLHDLKYTNYADGNIYLAGSANLNKDRGGGNVDFNVVMKMSK
jgi:hypothetical protein